MREGDKFEKEGLAHPSSYFLRENDVLPPSFPLHTTKEKLTSSYCYDRGLWVQEDIIVGRESDKEDMIELILSPSDQVHPNIIYVFGGPGIGKTTLAKCVCNDVRVSKFDLVLWPLATSTVGTFNHAEYLDLRRIMIGIIQSAAVTQSPVHVSMEWLESSMGAILHGKKYLLVLDEFEWPEATVWELLRKHLEVGSMGSTVILMNSSMEGKPADLRSLRLKGLAEHESWSLFTRCAAFDAGEEAERHPGLEQIRRKIVKLCDGNPLALKIFGNTLQSNRDQHTWRQITDIDQSCSGDEVSAAMSFAFEKLPDELMQCFSAISTEKVLSRDQLVYLWMAHGLLPSNQHDEGLLRDIGYVYCDELLLMGFLQLCHTDDSPSHETLKMHHQAWKLAQTLLSKETEHFPAQSLVEVMGRDLQWKGDHVPSDANYDWEMFKRIEARSFFFKHSVGPVTKSFLEGLISALKYVHVLLLDHSEFEELPETIGNLLQLRYLSLAGNRRLEAIPESLWNIVNLQTLDLSGCEQLMTLPDGIHRLVNLRHLLLSVNLPSLPIGILYGLDQLLHLRICNCQNLISLPGDIYHLSNLRVLQIHNCPSITSLPGTIMYLRHLKELSIINCQALDLTNWHFFYCLATGLRLLHIEGIPELSKFPYEFALHARSLRILVVRNCVNLRDLPEFYFCKTLLELVIDGCPNLVTLPTEIEAVNSLEVLKISNCPELAKRITRERGEDWHLISHIPNIKVDHQLIQNIDKLGFVSGLGKRRSAISFFRNLSIQLDKPYPQGRAVYCDTPKLHAP